MLHEQGDVLPALAQRGQVDGDHVQPVVEVLAEAAGADLAAQVAGGGRHQADLDARGLHATHPLELALLDRAQELHLHLHRDLADLVEEERAPVGQLESTRLGLHRAGESPLLEPEQLRFHQLARDGRAVDLDERPLAPGRGLVQRGRDQLLAGAALALDEHGRGRVGDLGDHLLQLLHLPAAADDLRVAARGAFLPLLGDDVALVVVALPRRLGDDRLELPVIERLGEEIEGARLHRLDRAVDPAMGSDHDHRHVGVPRDDLAQEGQAVHARHDQVGHNHIRAVALQSGDGLLPVPTDGHLVPFALQRGREDFPETLLVVHDEDAIGHRGDGLPRAQGAGNH